MTNSLTALLSSFKTIARDKLVLDMRWNNGGDTGLVPAVLASLIRNVKIDQPGKLMVSISDLYWQSSWPTDYRVWIPPLIYSPPRFAGYRQNHDEALGAMLNDQ